MARDLHRAGYDFSTSLEGAPHTEIAVALAIMFDQMSYYLKLDDETLERLINAALDAKKSKSFYTRSPAP